MKVEKNKTAKHSEMIDASFCLQQQVVSRCIHCKNNLKGDISSLAMFDITSPPRSCRLTKRAPLADCVRDMRLPEIHRTLKARIDVQTTAAFIVRKQLRRAIDAGTLQRCIVPER